jgi:hypothetical protein
VKVSSQQKLCRKVNNKSFKMWQEFNYLGTRASNENRTQEKIKSRLNSGSIVFMSATKRYCKFTSCFVWCETWYLTSWQGHQLRAFENMMLRRIFGHNRDIT